MVAHARLIVLVCAAVAVAALPLPAELVFFSSIHVLLTCFSTKGMMFRLGVRARLKMLWLVKKGQHLKVLTPSVRKYLGKCTGLTDWFLITLAMDVDSAKPHSMHNLLDAARKRQKIKADTKDDADHPMAALTAQMGKTSLGR